MLKIIGYTDLAPFCARRCAIQTFGARSHSVVAMGTTLTLLLILDSQALLCGHV